MSDSLESVLVGTSALSLLLVVAIGATIGRPFPNCDPRARGRLIRLFLVGVVLQCFHFLEELLTGFHVRFPELLGLTPWTPELFVAFNVSWIAIWILSAVALREGVRAALVPIWFFVLGMTVNGVAHPALALEAGGYFPGLATSPAVGFVGAVLWIRLAAITRKS